jgi:single-stranded-DNA-specific exonuclease
MLWKQRSTADEAVVAAIGAGARVPPLIARLLVLRGIGDPEEAARFLAPSLDHLHSPYGMMGMSAAVDRLSAALERREKMLIYGDYDVDGTVAIVVLKSAIDICGAAYGAPPGSLCEFHVPHRIHDGYGMKDDVIERAAGAGIRLVISVDTGIRAFAAAETARRLGLDLIVTDHHLPQAEGVPKAIAVLNPSQPGCGYPCKDLCGAGVAFKLAQAILEKAGKARLLPSFLKLVAIATIADVVSLTGENRVFARIGLDGLREPANPGLKALMEVAEVSHGHALTAGEVSFRLAPRLNAAGRMDVARMVIDLFDAHDPAVAREIARRLNELNLERQHEERRIVQEIEARLAADSALRDAPCMIIDGERWHKGVIGIAATRLLERYCRPVLVITREGDQAQGSARSVPGFHMLDALESCAPLFTRFGGHAHAAGFALPCSRLPELRAALEARARECLHPEDLAPSLTYDAQISADEITPELFAHLQDMEPFGLGNPEPVFVARGLRLMAAARVFKEKHLKLCVREADSAHPRGFEALGWQMAERLQAEPLRPQDRLDLAFSIIRNSHPDFRGLELSLRDFRKQ